MLSSAKELKVDLEEQLELINALVKHLESEEEILSREESTMQEYLKIRVNRD